MCLVFLVYKYLFCILMVQIITLMGYIAKYYDKKTLTEKVWHNSSMIKYSEMTEDPNENYGTLTVVFNNGATYRYDKVSLGDYVYTVAGGIDASNGKTFNKVIKERGYAYEKIDPLPQSYINEEYDKYLKMVQDYGVTYFISGPENFTDEEFDHFIAVKLAMTQDIDEEPKFILADSPVFGKRVQEYLINILGVKPENITVCKLSEDEDSYAVDGVNVNDEFDSEAEMDEKMTKCSIDDIALIRGNWEAELTRQTKNIIRRYLKTSSNLKKFENE